MITNNYYNFNCNRKTKSNCPMNGMSNLKNVMHQFTIFLKKKVKDKKKYI